MLETSQNGCKNKNFLHRFAAMQVVVLLTDFGWEGPYIGQMEAAALAAAHRVRVVHLMHDAPRFRPREAAYLLAAAVEALPKDWVVCAVVDPEVGGARRAVALKTERRWFVGPDNGLLAIAAKRAQEASWYALPIPDEASASFHGRDVFAPAAARLAAGLPCPMQRIDDPVGRDWPIEDARVIYIDGFGNAMLALWGDRPRRLRLHGKELCWARTFCDVPKAEALAYCNSLGLVEIAVREGSAAARFGLAIGDPVELLD